MQYDEISGVAADPHSAADVRRECLRLGFELVGLARVQPSAHGRYLRDWLAAGRHGTMSYLAREDAVERRLRPDVAHPELRSAIVLGVSYADDPDADPVPDAARGVIARYARGRDYHKVIKSRLLTLLRRLEEQAGTALPLARASVDTAPVLERELAQRAGLGWFGRSTMLINPKRGSYFFLATLLVELEFDEYDTPFERDHCGTCNACVAACPTGALLGRDESGAPVMDATRCISYLTIENRGEIPRELRPLIGNRIFGCDICQEVCPYTRKFSRPSSEPAFASRGPGEAPFGVQLEAGVSTSHPGTRSPSLIALLETALEEEAWDSFSRGSAIRRSGRAGFARNVCVGLGNWGSPAAVPVLSRALSDPEPLVRAHAAWALGRVGSAEARSALSAYASVETDARVLYELAAAMDA
ncbi:MAG TPA: tRNA epoxyqueuosine(34) reductase QueG [Longimicrobiales bacterium]|nr:tRNA epoxyqueuosine(34) reductase QueG [Longimicrobiales bacterium]